MPKRKRGAIVLTIVNETRAIVRAGDLSISPGVAKLDAVDVGKLTPATLAAVAKHPALSVTGADAAAKLAKAVVTKPEAPHRKAAAAVLQAPGNAAAETPAAPAAESATPGDGLKVLPKPSKAKKGSEA